MVEYLIYEFSTEEEALACLRAVDEMAAQYWASLGYTVVDAGQGKSLFPVVALPFKAFCFISAPNDKKTISAFRLEI